MNAEPLPPVQKDSQETTQESSRYAVSWLWLLAAPVIYLLSVPPLYTGITTNWGTIYPKTPPAWLDHYKQPFQWTYDHTVLQEPLDAYTLWWRSFFFNRIAKKPAVHP